MGIGKGVEVKVERVAPLGDPIEIVVKGCHITLRKTEAACIKIERAKEQ
jgi:Fe2+ transport system protein FeoA